jgi:cytoskeletal protein CcmA (bactofilin family)
MFNKGNKSEILNTEKVDTLIGLSTTIEGTIKASGTLRINGNVTGELIVAGSVIIGDSSTIRGNIKAENVYVAGTVHGNITSTGQLQMTSTAKVIGDVDVKNIIIDEGAVFDGHCKAVANDNSISKEKGKEKNNVA